jgi:hypothetical protein
MDIHDSPSQRTVAEIDLSHAVIIKLKPLQTISDPHVMSCLCQGNDTKTGLLYNNIILLLLDIFFYSNMKLTSPSGLCGNICTLEGVLSIRGYFMSTKDFKTIDEQLEILRSRGLIIDDENIAKEFLLYNNYYLISGYSLTLRKNNIFSKSASFQNIIDIYNFDHELRHVILQYREIISKANQQKVQRLSHEAYLKHFVNDLQQDIPLWAYADLFTISDISFMYSISEQPIRDAIMH